MNDAIKVLLLVVSALFPIVDPLTGSPIFLALTRECSPPVRRMLARRVAIDSFFLMIGSYFIGSHILGFFGVSLPVVQVAGGVALCGIAWTLLMEKEESARTRAASVPADHVFRRAFYPLTMPLTVGPGSISVAVTLGANATRRYGIHLLTLSAALISTALIAVSVYVCYAFADRLAQMLGETATAVIIRLASFLLLCIGIQIIWNGTSELLSSVSWHVR